MSRTDQVSADEDRKSNKSVAPVSADEDRKSNKSVAPTDATSIYNFDDGIQQLVDKIDHTNSSSSTVEFYPGVERIDYDFVAERRNVYSTNLIESTAHLFKGCVGSGILAIHEGYMKGGLWTSLGLSLIIGFIYSYNMLTLVRSAQKMYTLLRVPKLSYPDLAEVSLATGPIKCCRRLSRFFRHTVDILIFIHMYSVCCIYQIVIARTLKQTLENISEDFGDMKLPVRVYMMMVTVPLIMLCLIRNLKYLAPFAIVANIFIAIGVITSLHYSVAASSPISKRPAWKSFDGVMHFYGIFAFSIDGMSLVLPIENNMRNPKFFRLVVQYGMSLVVTLISLVGFFGYWGWGESCRSPITIHMPNTLGTTILQFLLMIVLCISFAVQFWVPFRISWHYIGIHFNRKLGNWERIFRTIHVIMLMGLSIAFPNMIEFMSFMGNFFLAFISFIFPSFIEALVTWNEHHYKRWKLLKNLFIFSMGVFMIFSALYSRSDQF